MGGGVSQAFGGSGPEVVVEAVGHGSSDAFEDGMWCRAISFRLEEIA